MTFRLELLVPDKLLAAPGLADLVALDTYARGAHDELVHVIAAQCRALAATGAISFEVAGFGQERWPVDVETDLAIVMEQLPGVLAKLPTEGEIFELNFFEQGIERYITGRTHAGVTAFECRSLSLAWTPEPSVERVPVENAERMFLELRDRYCAAIELVTPSLAHEPVFEQWRRFSFSS